MEIIPFTDSFSTAYLLVEGDRAMLVDASLAPIAPKVLDALRDAGATLNLIVLTHFHYDHVGAADELRQATGARIAVHHRDAAALREGGVLHLTPTGPFASLLERQIRKLDNAPLEPDIELQDEDDLTQYGGFGRTISTPGHTPGSLTVLLDDGTAFVGDALSEAFLGHRAAAPRFIEDETATSESLSLIDREATTVYVAHRGKLDRDSLSRYVAKHGAGSHDGH